MISNFFDAVFMLFGLFAECEVFQAIAALGLVALAFGVVYRSIGVDSLEV